MANGDRAVTVLPANRSIIFADSRFRRPNVLEEPYDFTADLGGTGIYAKEILYQKLFWNQPIFSHNNVNSEFRFQLAFNGVWDGLTYVVYAMPFSLFTEFDGNPVGTSLLPPQVNSYAANMELALNGDVRTIPLNLTPVNGNGIIIEPVIYGSHPVVIAFRYAPGRGFVIYPVQSALPGAPVYTIKLLPCNYIQYGHFVHGFGIFDPTIPNIYVPRNYFTVAYWGDTAPTLLPTRYIVILSQELNKDRRLISFHSGDFARFVNELAIFPTSFEHTGVYHVDSAGADSTTVSLRDDYTPQRFRIQICDEDGDVIQCDDPLSAALQSDVILPEDRNSFFGTQYPNRGDPAFINWLTFAEEGVLTTPAPLLYHLSNNLASAPMPNRGMWNWYAANPARKTIPFTSGQNQVWNAIVQSQIPLNLGGPTNPIVGASQQFGFSSRSFFENGGTGTDDQQYNFWTWYPSYNRNPKFIIEPKVYSLGALGIRLINGPFFYSQENVTFWLGMFYFNGGNFSNEGSTVIGKTSIGQFRGIIPGIQTIVPTVTDANTWTWNPDPAVSNPQVPSTEVYFAFFASADRFDDGGALRWEIFHDEVAGVPDTTFEISSRNPIVVTGTQTSYVDPIIEDYIFGNPRSFALCEEVIHEILAVNEYN